MQRIRDKAENERNGHRQALIEIFNAYSKYHKEND